MRTGQVIDALFRYFNARRGYTYQLVNSYMFRWESDFWCLSDSGFVYEIEVKVSREDFKADFKKHRKHQILADKTDRYNDRRPNRFIYACPEGMIKPKELPPYAGLVYVPEDRRSKPKIIVKPPKIHSQRNDFTKRLLKKYYWAYLNKLGKVKYGKNFKFPNED